MIKPVYNKLGILNQLEKLLNEGAVQDRGLGGLGTMDQIRSVVGTMRIVVENAPSGYQTGRMTISWDCDLLIAEWIIENRRLMFQFSGNPWKSKWSLTTRDKIFLGTLKDELLEPGSLHRRIREFYTPLKTIRAKPRFWHRG